MPTAVDKLLENNIGAIRAGLIVSKETTFGIIG